MAASARWGLPQGGDRLLGDRPSRQPRARIIPLVTEMLTAPRFAPEDFERLRNEALDYVTKILRGNNDEELGKWTLQVELYTGPSLRSPGSRDRRRA